MQPNLYWQKRICIWRAIQGPALAVQAARSAGLALRHYAPCRAARPRVRRDGAGAGAGGSGR